MSSDEKNTDVNAAEEIKLPEVEGNKSEEVHAPGTAVQLSMDPDMEAQEGKQKATAEERTKLKAVLEGLLFLTGDDGLTLEQAAQTLEISKEETASLFEELENDYADDARGFEIECYGKTYRFLSKAFVHEYAKKLFQMDKEARLSNAALETLAIIAYKQPITRVEIEEIRGVGADVMLRKLEARGLIQESGRSDAPGRPILYSVTDEFMDAFSLMSLDELPDLPKFDENQEGSDDLFTQ